MSALGRISYESPVGQALMDRRAGDRVAVETLAGPAWLDVRLRQLDQLDAEKDTAMDKAMVVEQ